jgi:hypothetical protein
MSNFNRPYNYERDLTTKYNKNKQNEQNDSDYIDRKIDFHRNKFKNDEYNFKENKIPLNPIYNPSALISNQIDFNQENIINQKEYDPFLHYLNEKGLYDKNTKIRYNVDYVVIDSTYRNKISNNIVNNYNKLKNNSLSIKKNMIYIKIEPSEIQNYNIGDKISITDLKPFDQIYRSSTTGNTIITFIAGKSYIQVNMNPNTNVSQYINYVNVDTTNVKVTISGIKGVKTVGFINYNDDNSAFIGNVPISFINSEHQIYITPPGTLITPQPNIFYVLMPYISDGTNIATNSIYNITFSFNHYNFIPINQINANYPINSNQLNGFQLIKEIGYNYITFEIYPPLDLDNPNNSEYEFLNFGTCIYIGKIEQTVIGYPSQNDYTISLNKLFTNVILIRLIDTSFTNPNKTIFDCGEEKNNRIYFQSIENISEIQFIEIDSGLYTIDTLKQIIEKKFSETSRNITDTIFNYDLNYNVIFNGDLSTNIISFESYKTKTLQVPIISTNPIINPVDTSIGTGTYTITIKHDNHGITSSTENILFSGFIEHLGLYAFDLNGLHTVTVIDKDTYEFTLTNINLNPTKISTLGGRSVNVLVPSQIKLFFNYKDTIGKVLGFRDVGCDYAITNFNYKIKNTDLYMNEVTNINNKCKKVNDIILNKFKYFFITCKELPIITDTDKVINIFAKIIMTNDNLLIDTFSLTPQYYYDPIRELYQLTLQFYYPNGELVDFNDCDHTFTLEITTFDNLPELSNITTNITIDKQ